MERASPFTITEEQMAGYFSDPVQGSVLFGIEWLVSDKANTLFALLFGIGFWVQMQRLEARGADFEATYLRRLTVLLGLGVAHLFLFWPWDILHMYAAMGFLLFAMRRISAKSMLLIGVPLALLARPVAVWLIEAFELDAAGKATVLSQAGILERQAVFDGGTYTQWVEQVFQLHWLEYFSTGLVLGWLGYVLGRFLVGAWIARQGWLQRTGELLPQIRKICIIALPVGLALELIYTMMDFEIVPKIFGLTPAIHAIGVPILDLGYATGLILLFNKASTSWLPKLFAPVGRMALTNYIIQSVLYFWLLYGIAGGFSMVGDLMPSQTLSIALIFFALQIVFSILWLRAFRYGPLEWLWRAATYGEFPRIRRDLGVASQPA
ncbi:DUF418 domain-containing protein [Sphingomicrobium sp. XHP0239]|uniref:DUF418 domain-containing protein n=1 Tax=Sphingomicrobium maritimum TaxID=3133972 RepID=UPI0031CC83EC